MQIKLCRKCIHYRGNLRCRAFSEGIPDEILEGENDHSKPLKGQKNNIVFEPLDRGNNTDIKLTPMPESVVVRLIDKVQEKVLPYLTGGEIQAVKTFLDTGKVSNELNQAIKKGGFDYDLTLWMGVEQDIVDGYLQMGSVAEGTYLETTSATKVRGKHGKGSAIKVKSPSNLPKLPVKKWTGKPELILEGGSYFRIDYVDTANKIVEATHFKRFK